MKPKGSLMDSLIKKFTLLLFELFWIPIIKIKNKDKLNEKAKINFFIGRNIFNLVLEHIINDTFCKVIFFC